MSNPRGTARIRIDLDDAICIHTALSYYKQRPEAPEGEWERITRMQERLTGAVQRMEQGVDYGTGFPWGRIGSRCRDDAARVLGPRIEDSGGLA